MRITTLDKLHQRLRDMFIAKLQAKARGEDTTEAGAEIDTLLNTCAGIEYCEQCASIFCPWREPLHFHHDGCPCCATIDDDAWDQAAADARLLHNNLNPVSPI